MKADTAKRSSVQGALRSRCARAVACLVSFIVFLVAARTGGAPVESPPPTGLLRILSTLG